MPGFLQPHFYSGIDKRGVKCYNRKYRKILTYQGVI